MTYSENKNDVDIVIKCIRTSKTWRQCLDGYSIFGGSMPMNDSMSFLLNVCLTHIVYQPQTMISDTLSDTILK